MTRLGYVPSDAPVDGIGEERHVEEDDPYLESDEDEVSDGGFGGRQGGKLGRRERRGEKEGGGE